MQAALTPIWPQVVPEAACNVLTTCAQIAVSRGVTGLLPTVSNISATTMLELTAGWVAADSPDPGARFTPPAAYASSAAFDRSEDAETFAAAALLMALAHPRRAGARRRLLVGHLPGVRRRRPARHLRVPMLGPVRLLRMRRQ